MKPSPSLPELVQDSELEVTVHDNITLHAEPLECREEFLPQVWETKRTLGRGGDGTVFLQQKIEGPGPIDMLAVKQISLNNDLASEDHESKRYVRELEALAKFAQPRYGRYFVRSYGWYQEAGWLYICMEYCKHLDLGKHLKSLGALSEESARVIALQVLQGLVQMHRNKIAHRDLKPSNILVHRKPPEDDTWWVVLGDLGLSRRGGLSSGSTTIRGTPNFMAPETIGAPFLGEPNNADPFQADIWCLGETIACALTGQSTFSGSKQLLNYQKRSIPFPDGALKYSSASVDAIDFVCSLMQVDPLQRPTAAQALDHPWIKGNRTLQTQECKEITERAVNDTGNASPVIIKSVDGGVVCSGNGEFTTLDQITEASAQWTQTIPMTVKETNSKPESLKRTATPPMITPNLSDRRTAVQHTSKPVTARGKDLSTSRQASSSDSAQQSEVVTYDAHVKTIDLTEHRTSVALDPEALHSFEQISHAERLRAHENQRNRVYMGGKTERLKEFEDSSEDIQKIDPIPDGLFPILSSNGWKQRQIEDRQGHIVEIQKQMEDLQRQFEDRQKKGFPAEPDEITCILEARGFSCSVSKLRDQIRCILVRKRQKHRNVIPRLTSPSQPSPPPPPTL